MIFLPKVVGKCFGWSWSKYGCGQSALWTLNLTVSKLYLKNEQMELTDILHVDTNSQKLEVDQIFLGWARSNMSLASQVIGL